MGDTLTVLSGKLAHPSVSVVPVTDMMPGLPGLRGAVQGLARQFPVRVMPACLA
jgi:hypothetical protein